MLKLITVLAAINVFALLEGVVLSTMWGWFVVPLGVASIGVAHAIGLSLTVSFVTSQYSDWDTGDHYEDLKKRAIWTVSIASTVMIIGFIAQSTL